MLDLGDKQKMEKAVEIIEKEAPDFIKKLLPLTINFNSLETFSDLKPSVLNPSIFFLNFEEDKTSQKLKIFGDFLIRRCIEEGIIEIETKGGNYRFHRSLIQVDINEIPTGKFSYIGTIKEKKKIPDVDIEDETFRDCIHNYPHVTILTGCRQPKTYEEIISKDVSELGGIENVEQKWKKILKEREASVNWRFLIKEFNEYAEAEGLFNQLKGIQLKSVDLSIRRGTPKDGGYFHAARIEI